MSHLRALSPQLFWPYFAAAAFSLIAMIALARPSPSHHDRRFLFALAPICFAVPMAVFGADHLSDPLAIMLIVPAWMPGRLFWTYLVGVCLIAAALSLVLKIQHRPASLLLASMLLVFVLLIHIPNAWAKPGDRFRWIYAARDLAFGCGAFSLGMNEGERTRWGERYLLIMQFVIAAISIFFGVETLQHPECVPGVPLEELIPGWIPLARVWTSLTGVALLVGGVAMFSARTRQRAAMALGVLVLLLTIFLYLPIMIAKPDVDSLNSATDTLVFAGTFLAMASAMANSRVRQASR